MKNTWTESRKELAEKYFGEASVITETYGKGNMGIIALLSDLQHHLAKTGTTNNLNEHYIQALNDVKQVLISDHKKDDAVTCHECGKLVLHINENEKCDGCNE